MANLNWITGDNVNFFFKEQGKKSNFRDKKAGKLSLKVINFEEQGNTSKYLKGAKEQGLPFPREGFKMVILFEILTASAESPL